MILCTGCVNQALLRSYEAVQTSVPRAPAAKDCQFNAASSDHAKPFTDAKPFSRRFLTMTAPLILSREPAENHAGVQRDSQSAF